MAIIGKPVHRDQVRLFVRGVITILVLGLVAFIGTRVQGGNELPFKSYTYVRAEFTDIGMLNTRNEVTRNGVRIGQVSKTEYSPDGAVVTMRIDGEVDVYRDATAVVVNKSALGRKTVSLDVGSPESGDLSDGVIPRSQTTDSVALDDALGSFDPETREALRTILRETGGGVLGHSDDLNDVVLSAPELLAGAGDVSRTLADPDAELPALLGAADTLAGRFDGRTDDIAELVQGLDSTLAALAVEEGAPLAETIDRAPAALRQARTGLDALRTPLRDVGATMDQLDGGVEALVRSENDLRNFLRTSVTPLDRVPGVSTLATPAVDDLTGLLEDARPLVTSASQTITSASLLLDGLSPYSLDIGGLARAHRMLSGRLAPGKHYFSAMLVFPGLYSASLPDPITKQVPYPKPGGGAWFDNPSGGRP